VDEVEKSLPKHHVLYNLLKAPDEESPQCNEQSHEADVAA